LLKEDKPIGLISFWRDDGFFGQDANPNDYGFGYFIDPDERGQGLIKDTVLHIMDIAQEHLYVRRFEAFCEDDNPASIGVLTGLSFTPTEDTFGEPTHGWVERRYERVVDVE
jgi:RimJ/RimL family protein N-acetyltransferase